MKRFTVSQARERLADVLDEAERGGTAVIERRDVQYVITAKKRRGARARRGSSVIDLLDPAIEQGDWTWAWSPRGLRFKAPRSRA